MKSCVYCKQECEHRICLSCDGKHGARMIYKLVNREKILHREKGWIRKPNEDRLKQYLIKRDILGLEGLNQNERNQFFNAFNFEYKKMSEGIGGD